ncbi:type II secretion system F family protein [Geomonas subterranea]|uniref:Type II secretion system F family protein n=1 Tax=Geomonas subterranea TaxID=2847989 RepID=A0ABX8LFP6_9BACT|nr:MULTISPECIES: type II secretion system F family protein [Geomonas]QXE90873.1 type II secretion system F family protein [Geomonas subterranea]QXM11043.1 type II secretion system F family protein [Geomonas subterranea]
MLYLIAFTVFCSVLLLSLALSRVLVSRRSPVAQRMAAFFPTAKPLRLMPEIESGTWAAKLQRIGERMNLPKQEQSRYRKALVAAGLHRDSVHVFLGSKLLLAVTLPLPYLLISVAPRRAYFDSMNLVILLVCAIVGYLLPSYWLSVKVKSRQLIIFHTLPDVLDLVTLCVEAGVSMDAALLRACEVPQLDQNPLAQEIRQATMEIRAGKPRVNALKDMAERTMVDDMRSFTTMLAQTERFGTSLSQALRSFSDDLRTKRRQAAEEAAAKTTIKLIFPLVFAIFPALLVVVLGPAVVQISRAFK